MDHMYELDAGKKSALVEQMFQCFLFIYLKQANKDVMAPAPEKKKPSKVHADPRPDVFISLRFLECCYT